MGLGHPFSPGGSSPALGAWEPFQLPGTSSEPALSSATVHCHAMVHCRAVAGCCPPADTSCREQMPGARGWALQRVGAAGLATQLPLPWKSMRPSPSVSAAWITASASSSDKGITGMLLGMVDRMYLRSRRLQLRCRQEAVTRPQRRGTSKCSETHGCFGTTAEVGSRAEPPMHGCPGPPQEAPKACGWEQGLGPGQLLDLVPLDEAAVVLVQHLEGLADVLLPRTRRLELLHVLEELGVVEGGCG